MSKYAPLWHSIRRCYIISYNLNTEQDITLKTPLMKATRNGKLEAVKKLLITGSKPNVRDKNRDTALHFAARHGSAGLLKVKNNSMDYK